MICWRIIGETETHTFKSEINMDSEPVSDADIKDYIYKIVKRNNISYAADELLHLVFLGVSDETDTEIYEELSPRDFWPIEHSLFSDPDYLKIRKPTRKTFGGEK